MKMKDYFGNVWIRVGLALVVFGWAPLLAITLLAAIGFWPHLDPIVPRLLYFFTGWPAVFCLVIGFFQVKRDRVLGTAQVGAVPAQAHEDSPPWREHPAARVVLGLVGMGLVVYGTNAMLHGEGRGAAVALAVGVVAVYWAFVGRLPFWFWR